MADTKSAAFSGENAALSALQDERHYDGGSLVHGAVGAQAVAGDGAALVLPQPFPRKPRRAPLPRMHGLVKCA